MMLAALSDWLALPRFVIESGWLPWWLWLIVAGLVWFTAGGVRAALRLVMVLAVVLVGTVVGVSTWIHRNPEVVTGPVETVRQADRVIR